MARKNTDDLCFICDRAPCECGKPAKPKKQVKTKVKATPAEPVVKSPGPSFREAMKAAAAQAPLAPPKIEATPSRSMSVRPVLSDEEIVFNDAIRALAGAGLLCEEDRQHYRGIITSSSDPIASWKARKRLEEVDT
jgi:hypothetical protein